jgi:hypothetical protein
MGKPRFKASDGGQIDILEELEGVTQSEFQLVQRRGRAISHKGSP